MQGAENIHCALVGLSFSSDAVMEGTFIFRYEFDIAGEFIQNNAAHFLGFLDWSQLR